MYTIKRNNKRYNNKKFENYEAARKYCIKKIRGMNVLSKGVYPRLRDAGFAVIKL